MNERILEIAQQAGWDISEIMKMQNAHRMFKFAQLIVQECMNLNSTILCEDDPDYVNYIYAEHFGIE